MTIQHTTTYECDRCGHKEKVPYGSQAPKDTHKISLSPQDGVSMYLIHTLCGDCAKDFNNWFDKGRAKSNVHAFSATVIPLSGDVFSTCVCGWRSLHSSSIEEALNLWTNHAATVQQNNHST